VDWAAVADPGKSCNVASLQARAQRHAREHGDEIAKHGNGRDHVALFDVAEVRCARRGLWWVNRPSPCIASWCPEARKPRTSSAPWFAYHGREPVILIKGVGRGARAGFLAQPEINSSDYLSLLIKIFQSDLHFAVEQHVAVDLDALLLAQVLRVADGRDGRAEVAGDFVADVLGAVLVFLDRLADAEVGCSRRVSGME